jgi:hypothetical protein
MACVADGHSGNTVSESIVLDKHDRVNQDVERACGSHGDLTLGLLTVSAGENVVPTVGCGSEVAVFDHKVRCLPHTLVTRADGDSQSSLTRGGCSMVWRLASNLGQSLAAMADAYCAAASM